MTFNIFPTRIEIGQFEPSPGAKPVKVYMSPEFSRAFAAVFEQLGGAPGMDINSLAALASFTPEAPVPIPAVDTAVASLSAEVVALRDQLAQSSAQLDAARADIAPLERRIETLEAQMQPAPAGTDWEHPGFIGAKTANRGTFTTANTGAGLVGAPSFYLGTDTTTGLYRPALDSWGLTVAGALVATWSATGVAYLQNITTAGAFACNGKPAQASYAVGAVLAAYAPGAAGLLLPADMAALVAKVVALETALKNNGIAV